jgi:hypothetical protein
MELSSLSHLSVLSRDAKALYQEQAPPVTLVETSAMWMHAIVRPAAASAGYRDASSRVASM